MLKLNPSTRNQKFQELASCGYAPVHGHQFPVGGVSVLACGGNGVGMMIGWVSADVIPVGNLAQHFCFDLLASCEERRVVHDLPARSSGGFQNTLDARS